RDDGQGHLRLDPAGHPRSRRRLRAGPGDRCRGRPGADRATVRHAGLRLPGSRGQPYPHPRAALSSPEVIGSMAEKRTAKQSTKKTAKSAKRPTESGKTSKGWTADERAAAKAYAEELKAEARGANDERAALA